VTKCHFWTFSIIVILRLHCEICQSSFNTVQYTIVELTPSIIHLYPPFSHSLNSFNISHMSAYYFHHNPPPTSFPYIFPLKVQRPRQHQFYLPVLHFWKKDILTCIMKLYKKLHCDISTYICTLTWICSSPLFPHLLPWSCSHVDFNRFKYFISILIQKYINYIHLLNFLLFPSISH
jgi:hypothetical protein